MLPPIFPKPHGMIDKRWTVKDKIIQYKGLVKLFERDVKILQTDRHITERKQIREFRQLKKDIGARREELSTAIKGDGQHYRNVLSKHKSLQRTFQDQVPETTLEHIEHKNFNKRKLLDRLKCKTETKFRELIAQKLTYAELQDNLIVNKKTKTERMGEIISGKVQDVNIKLEAALQIKYIYKQILDVLKKDKIYFDSALNQLTKDACNQSMCIYQATQIGQLATEYTDDRKHELELLKRAVKRDMKSRSLQMHIAEGQVNQLHDYLKKLVPKESTPKIDGIPKATFENQMQQDLQCLEKILEDLQNITYTSKFEDILPCLQEQDHKNKKVTSLLKKSISDKEILRNKIKHAKSVYLHLTNTTECSTFEYMKEKVTLKQTLEDSSIKLQKLKKRLEEQSNLATKIQSVLLHLQELCRIVKNSNEPHSKKFLVQTAQSISNKIVYPPQQSEIDAFKIIADLETRLSTLMNNEDHEIEKLMQADVNAEKYFQKFISQISRTVSMDEEDIHDALILEVEPKDRNVLTREFIKKKSQFIVEQNAKPDWML